MPPGLLLIGHGTRNQTGTRQFLDLAEFVRRRLSPVAAQAAFLELREPGIEAGIEHLAAAGVKEAVVVPLLLFAAGHAKRDIPRTISRAADRRGMTTTQTEPLGCEEALLELSHRRFCEAMSAIRPDSPNGPKAVMSLRSPEDCLLLVGRGSRDAEATAAMHEFARLRQEREGGIATEVAFLAMARPSLAEQLPRIAAAAYRRVIVQPHLLFEGELSAGLTSEIVRISAQHSQTQWLFTPLLADPIGAEGIGTQVLGEVICQRYHQAAIRVAAGAGEH